MDDRINKYTRIYASAECWGIEIRLFAYQDGPLWLPRLVSEAKSRLALYKGINNKTEEGKVIFNTLDFTGFELTLLDWFPPIGEDDE